MSDKLPRSVVVEYNRLRASGMSPEEARRALNIVKSDDGYVQSRGAVQEAARGLTLGGTEALTGLGAGVGFLAKQPGRLIPGRDPFEVIGGGLEDVSVAGREKAREVLDPRGRAGAAGRIVGRIAGEVGTTIATAGLARAPRERLTALFWLRTLELS
jgi:hypothetical protein